MVPVVATDVLPQRQLVGDGHRVEEAHDLGRTSQVIENVEKVALDQRPEMFVLGEHKFGADPKVVGDDSYVLGGRDVSAGQVLVELLAIDPDLAADLGDRALPAAQQSQIGGECGLSGGKVAKGRVRRHVSRLRAWCFILRR
jgi:hypothetical protein